MLGSHGEMSSPVWEARWSSLARPESVFCMLEQRKAEAKLGQVPEIHSQGKHETLARRPGGNETVKRKAINLIPVGVSDCFGHLSKGQPWASWTMLRGTT